MMDPNTARYVCPNCFSQRAANDVLFFRNVLSRTPDRRKLQYWRRFHPEAPDGTPARDDYLCLANWRLYPAERRLVREGLIEGLRDYSGDELRLRVCPECGYRVRDVQIPWIHPLFWSARGVDLGLGEQLLSELGGHRMSALPGVILLDRVRASLADGTVIQLPTGLWRNGKPLDPGVFQRYQRFSNAAVLCLELDATTGGKPVADYGANETLLGFTELDGYRGAPTIRPTAVLLQTADRDADPHSPADLLSVRHRNLSNALKLMLKNHSVFFRGRDSVAEMFQWLAEAVKGPGMRE